MARMPLTLCIVVAFCHIGSAQPPLPEPTPDNEPFDACRAVDDASLFKPLGEIRTKIPVDGRRLPPDCSTQFLAAQPGDHGPRFSRDIGYHWLATDFFYMPTYFDDVPLERYGQTKRRFLQPFISGSRLLIQFPALPYKMGVDRPHACITTLGHRPPGNCLPCIKQTLPHSSDATFVQAAATVGLVFLLP